MCIHTHGKSHLNENKFAMYKLYAVRWRVSSMVEGVPHRRGLLSVRWRIFSTDVTPSVRRRNMFSTVEGIQYGPVTSSIQRRVCSKDLSHRQYRGEFAVQDYQDCSRGSWWLYLSGEKLCFTYNLAITEISSYCG